MTDQSRNKLFADLCVPAHNRQTLLRAVQLRDVIFWRQKSLSVLLPKTLCASALTFNHRPAFGTSQKKTKNYFFQTGIGSVDLCMLTCKNWEI